MDEFPRETLTIKKENMGKKRSIVLCCVLEQTGLQSQANLWRLLTIPRPVTIAFFLVDSNCQHNVASIHCRLEARVWGGLRVDGECLGFELVVGGAGWCLKCFRC